MPLTPAVLSKLTLIASTLRAPPVGGDKLVATWGETTTIGALSIIASFLRWGNERAGSGRA